MESKNTLDYACPLWIGDTPATVYQTFHLISRYCALKTGRSRGFSEGGEGRKGQEEEGRGGSAGEEELCEVA